MYKETVICIITVILIIVLNVVTENYTKESVFELTNNLGELKENLSEETIKDKNINIKYEEIFSLWNDKYNTLAYYLEHDELEKVETNLTSLRSAIEAEEYPEALSELDETVFVLRHIERKNRFDLKNIF